MGVGGRRYDCFLCVTGGVREIVYFFVLVQEISFVYACVCGTGRGKVFPAAVVFLFFFFFSLRHRKRFIFLSFSVEGDEGRSVHIPTSCFKEANMRGLYRLQKGLSVGRRVHFNAVPS